MSTTLLVAIVGLSLIFVVLGCLWLIPRRNANFRAYEEISRAAERNRHSRPGSRHEVDWR